MKVLDPACGSGVFLVGAFRRLVWCWRMNHNWQRPEPSHLKAILRDSIFGADKEGEAVLITMFSLFVALCDELEPKVIWDKLNLDDLRTVGNLRGQDFFELVENGSVAKQFDLVIGNPPFISKLDSEAAGLVEDRSTKEGRPPTPDGQLALLFLDEAFKACKPNGTVCLLQPAGPLLHNVQAQQFRQHLLETRDVQVIFDFTPLEGALFKASVAAAAVLACNAPPGNDKLLHLLFPRTHSSKGKLLLETDHYCFHWLRRDYLCKHPHAFKVDLLGGGRLHRLMARFDGVETLDEWLDRKGKRCGWVCGEGYTIGCGKAPNSYDNPDELAGMPEKDIQEKFELKRRPKRAPHLTGKLNAPQGAIGADGIDPSKLKTLDAVFFEEPRPTRKKVFSAPQLLIAETVDRVNGRIRAALSETPLVFDKNIYGIHAPEEDRADLQQLSKLLTSTDLPGAILACTCPQYLVSRAGIFIQESLLRLPAPEAMQDAERDLAQWERELLEDTIRCQTAFRRKGENSDVMSAPDDDDLTAFAEIYCRSLNVVYEDFRPLQWLRMGSFMCYPFSYGEEPRIELPSKDEAADMLAKLGKKKGTRLFINRVIRLYEANVIFMVKPDQKRFWLRSIAMRDADETMAELAKEGF